VSTRLRLAQSVDVQRRWELEIGRIDDRWTPSLAAGFAEHHTEHNNDKKDGEKDASDWQAKWHVTQLTRIPRLSDRYAAGHACTHKQVSNS